MTAWVGIGEVGRQLGWRITAGRRELNLTVTSGWRTIGGGGGREGKFDCQQGWKMTAGLRGESLTGSSGKAYGETSFKS